MESRKTEISLQNDMWKRQPKKIKNSAHFSIHICKTIAKGTTMLIAFIYAKSTIFEPETVA